MDLSNFTKFFAAFWTYLPKLNLLIGTATSTYVLSSFMGLIQKPYAVTFSTEHLAGIPNMGLLLIFSLTLLYIIKYDELRTGIDHKVLNALSFATMLLAMGTVLSPSLLQYIPLVYENIDSDAITRGVVVTCSCYLGSPDNYALCVVGQIADCNNIMCAKTGDAKCNQRFLWMCGDDNKLHLTTCEKGCNDEGTSCTQIPEEPAYQDCEKGTKCIEDTLYVCDNHKWTPYKQCPAGCNYAQTNCVLEPIIISTHI